ncbi:MAG: flippase-like domain-containing protein [Actinobacteria bacterium]|nr:flippase-like domain-containing protein [Actinomycetota bacterium]
MTGYFNLHSNSKNFRMNPPHLPHRWSVRVILVLIAAIGVGLLLWFRGPNWSEVGQAFADVSWQWVLAAIVLNVLSVLIRALSWWSILGQALAGIRIRYSTALSAFSVGLMANALLPGWVGEFARVAVLHRKLENRRGLWPTLFGTVIAHRLLDLVPAISLAIWVILAAELPVWAYSSILTAIGIGVAIFLTGLTIAFLGYRSYSFDKLGPLRRAIGFLERGLAALRSPRASALAAVFQILGWLCQLLAVWSAMFAFNIDLPISAAAQVLVLMNIVTILPLWTGNVGLTQAAIALSLINYGVSYSLGFAYGIGVAVIETSVGIAYGLGFFAEEGISFASLRKATDEAARDIAANDHNHQVI